MSNNIPPSPYLLEIPITHMPNSYIVTMNGEGITATNMDVSPLDCDEECDVTITVTWENKSNRRRKFIPAIIVDGNKISLGTEIYLNKNDIITRTYNLTNLTEGTYNICPDPNAPVKD